MTEHLSLARFARYGWIIFGLAAFVAAVFWVTSWDLRAAAYFYDPEHPFGPWPAGGWVLFRVFYHGVPYLAGAVVGASVIVLAGSFWRAAWQRQRPLAAAVLLTYALGPGVVVNFIFKDHWGRPRPSQVELFGGTQAHIPPLAIGTPGEGKSFPAGHPSVGFALAVFFFAARSRRLRRGALAVALTLGLLMGAGRMASGSHFLSDVFFSGILTIGTAWGVVFALRGWFVRAATAADPPALRKPLPRWVVAGATALVLLSLAAGVLVATPFEERWQVALSPGSAIHFHRADVVVTLVEDGPPLELSGQVRGFGFPWNSLELRQSAVPARFEVVPVGHFTEFHQRVQVRLRPDRAEVVSLHVARGSVRVNAAELPAGLEVEAPRVRFAH